MLTRREHIKRSWGKGQRATAACSAWPQRKSRQRSIDWYAHTAVTSAKDKWGCVCVVGQRVYQSAIDVRGIVKDRGHVGNQWLLDPVLMLAQPPAATT